MSIPASRSPLQTKLAEEAAKIRKFKILYGQWWTHYAVPYELRWTLYAERAECPYSSGRLEQPLDDEGHEPAAPPPHIDHMDPLSRGGEESIRNAIYACASCNFAKGSRLFVDCLKTSPPANQAIAKTLYTTMHGHLPEAFRPGPRMLRLVLPRAELGFDESVLLQLFPQADRARAAAARKRERHAARVNNHSWYCSSGKLKIPGS
mgnify:FL=1